MRTKNTVTFKVRTLSQSGSLTINLGVRLACRFLVSVFLLIFALIFHKNGVEGKAEKNQDHV